MKRIFAGLALAAFSASLAIAADDPMAGRYGNTVVVTGPQGATKLHYNADGTMAVILPDGGKGTGKWKLNGDKLCVTPDVGPTAGKEQCNPFAANKKVGDTWEQPLADGTKATVTITQGR